MSIGMCFNDVDDLDINSCYPKELLVLPRSCGKTEVHWEILKRRFLDAKMAEYRSSRKFDIKRVIFNPPATIVFWKDGTKTVVKARGEDFDPEKGLAMAISKKALGNRYEYYNVFEEWLPEERPLLPTNDNDSEVFFDDTGERGCITCEHMGDFHLDGPCRECGVDYSKWTPKKEVTNDQENL